MNNEIKVGDTVYTETFNRLNTDRVVASIHERPGRTPYVEFTEGDPADLAHCYKGTLPTPGDFAPGDAIEAKAFGSWYAGTVVNAGRSKVKATYTSGTGKVYTKSLNMGQIRLAAQG